MAESPLPLSLTNAGLRHRVHETNQPLRDALSYVESALDKRGVTFFDTRDTTDRNQSIARTLELSLDLLTSDERELYQALAVFPQDVEIPLMTVANLWRQTGGYDDFDTEELCARLSQFSLLQVFDARARHIRLHSVMRYYLLEGLRDRLSVLHGQLLDANLPGASAEAAAKDGPLPATGWAALPEDEPYFWDYLAYHLVAAGRGSELVTTVMSLSYLVLKTRARGVQPVEADLVHG